MENRQRILIDHSLKKQIMEELNTTYPTIRTALYGMTRTDKAKAIRAKALELGGVLVTQPVQIAQAVEAKTVINHY